METVPARAWLVSELLLWLLAPTGAFKLHPALASGSAPSPALASGSAPSPALASGSAPGPAQVLVSSLVGADVLLPCSCPVLGPSALLHVQWSLESRGPVLEQRGQQIWTAEEFRARAESGPGTRNCSLLLRDLQVTDGGQYLGYLLQDPGQTRTKTRTGVFICSVKLLVFSHSSVEFKRPGEDLLLELHTPHAMTLVFQGSNSSVWRPLWRRGEGSPRVVKDPVKEQLSLRSVSDSDQGLYKVLDLNGLTVSSTRLSLDQHEVSGSNHDRHEVPGSDQEMKLLLRAGAVRVSCSLLLVVTSLLDL